MPADEFARRGRRRGASHRDGAAEMIAPAEPEATAASGARERARAIHRAGGIAEALASGAILRQVAVSLSEALVLGLLKQGVRKYIGIFGHGCTDRWKILRIYEEEGVTWTFNCRHEVAMSHAATVLSWSYGEVPAVVTSIGPGALQAMAGSLAAATGSVSITYTETKRRSAKATTCSKCRSASNIFTAGSPRS